MLMFVREALQQQIVIACLDNSLSEWICQLDEGNRVVLRMECQCGWGEFAGEIGVVGKTIDAGLSGGETLNTFVQCRIVIRTRIDNANVAERVLPRQLPLYQVAKHEGRPVHVARAPPVLNSHDVRDIIQVSLLPFRSPSCPLPPPR